MLAKPVRSSLSVAALAACLFWSGCGTDHPALPASNASLRPPVFDAAFRQQWDDGASEVSTYTTERLRGGLLRKGTATAVVRRSTYSEDERVPVEGAKRQQGDQFPAMQMNWIERYAAGLQTCEEMTTAALALSSIEGRAAGTATKADFSSQAWDGQLFHQLIFDATGIRSHQYSYFESEGDEQITLAYPNDGVAGDALWFWARHMAAPAMQPGEQRTAMVLPELRDVRSQRHSLSWVKATLELGSAPKLLAGKSVDVFTVTMGGGSETFLVETALPFRVMRWEDSAGEHADYVSGSRLKSWDAPATAPRGKK